MTKCDKPARERRILLVADSNGSVPSEDAVSNSRTVSESQEVGAQELCLILSEKSPPNKTKKKKITQSVYKDECHLVEED